MGLFHGLPTGGLGRMSNRVRYSRRPTLWHRNVPTTLRHFLPNRLTWLALICGDPDSGWLVRGFGAITKAGDVHAQTPLIEPPLQRLRRWNPGPVSSTGAASRPASRAIWPPSRRTPRRCARLPGTCRSGLPALPSQDSKGQAETGRGHRDRPRVGRVRLGDRLYRVGSAGNVLCN